MFDDKIWRRKYREDMRLQMIAAYGGKCKKCGETDPLVLTLDHIHNDGAAERAKGPASSGKGTDLYARLRKQGWPKKDHQLLCWNCNIRKEAKRRIKEQRAQMRATCQKRASTKTVRSPRKR